MNNDKPNEINTTKRTRKNFLRKIRLMNTIQKPNKNNCPTKSNNAVRARVRKSIMTNMLKTQVKKHFTKIFFEEARIL